MIGKRFLSLAAIIILLSISCNLLTNNQTLQPANATPKPNNDNNQPKVMADSFFYAYAYIDANNNGQIDPDDPPLEGAYFIAIDARGRSAGDKTDEKGQAMAWWPDESEYPITYKIKGPEGSDYVLVSPAEIVIESSSAYQPGKFLFQKATQQPAAVPSAGRLALQTFQEPNQPGIKIYLPITLKNYSTPPSSVARPWPDTTVGIHVFNDQLANGMSDEQWQFSATHYDGTQKMTRSDANRLRAIDPNFMILHYRLGDGLGWRVNACSTPGEYISIIEGDNWIQEWPGESNVQEQWFYHYPEGSSTRVLNCDWGWYLMELDNASFRSYWQSEVVRQIQANDDDGLFMDSLSVPNYMGGFSPEFPGEDVAFESAWKGRISRWLSWLQTQPVGRYWLVPNVGAWINNRDDTDYSAADGLMVEGFVLETDVSPWPLADWQLEMNRILQAVQRGQAIIAQPSVTGEQDRMYAVGSYLLIKGNRTYINIEISLEPEWFPEYDIPIGSPTQSATGSIDDLYDVTNRVYRRNYSNGFVLVNPTHPLDGFTTTVNLGGTYYLAVATGGGEVPPDGIPTGSLTYTPVTSVTLGPASAAVLLNSHP